jgi:hypothetical protein
VEICVNSWLFSEKLIVIEFFIRFLAAWFVVFPVVTLLHELGHGIVALIVVKDRPITCMLGTDSNQARFTLNIGRRLRILLNPGTGFFGRFLVEGSGTFSRSQTILISLAGPLVSLGMGLFFFLLPSFENSYLNEFRLLFLSCAMIQLVTTIIPVRYPHWFGGYRGMPSDGLRVWRALRQKKDPSVEGSGVV